MTAPRFVTADDGVRLAYRTLGEGRPLLLLHGFLSTGTTNWITPGHAAAFAAAGHRVIVADLRAHGASAKPTDGAHYPRDVLADDAFTLIEHLGLTDYDLAGYSLGARTALRLLARGATPRRAVVCGQGLRSITHEVGRVLGGGTEDWLEEQWRGRIGTDRIALRHVLGTSIPTPRDALARIAVPTLVVMGRDDAPADGRALAEVLLHGSYAAVPGNHFQAASTPELTAAVVDFLS